MQYPYRPLVVTLKDPLKGTLVRTARFLNQVPTLLQYPYRPLVVTLIEPFKEPFKGTLTALIKTQGFLIRFLHESVASGARCLKPSAPQDES